MKSPDEQTMGPPMDEDAIARELLNCIDDLQGLPKKPASHLYPDNTSIRSHIHRRDLIIRGTQLILEGIGVDITDRNFADTPRRYANFISELFWGPRPAITAFPETHDQMVIVRNHEAWTLCPHHLLPVRLVISIGYIPKGSVLGLSKLARLFDDINTQPLMQETAVDKLCTRLYHETGEMGAGVIMKGEHLCMRMRGIKSSHSEAITSKLMGVLRENPQARTEFLALAAVHSQP